MVSAIVKAGEPMIWVSRFILLATFAVFWGGLTLYTGIVVRVIHSVLPDPFDGGLITQQVTWYLQVLGAITAVLMLGNALLVSRNSGRYGIALGLCAALLGCAVAGLFIVHGHLDGIIDIESARITDRNFFTISHRRYNQLTTVEWLTSISYLAITIAAWRRTDTAGTGKKAA